MLPSAVVSSAQNEPGYAKTGSFATYQVLGGFIPFFDGVNGTISYSVTRLFTNGSMSIMVNGNVSQGNEVPTSNFTYMMNDNILRPKVFPAVSPTILTQHEFQYENTTCSFVRNSSSLSVPAGTFSTMEFSGTDSNGTAIYYWFDITSGLVVQMAQGGGVFQLQSSNIAVPNSVASGFLATLPFVETLGGTLGIGALLFLGIYIYYNRRGRNIPEKPTSGQPTGKKGASKGKGP